MSEVEKHTPAPWSWEYYPDFKHAIALASDKTDVLLVTSDINDQIYADVNEADARLIASAPELLEACSYALRWWVECGFDDEWHPSIRRKLETAIAKATGAKS